MVSVEFEGDYPRMRQNKSSEQSKKAFLRDASVPVFWFGTSNISDRDWCLGFPRASEEQCLLDSLLLAQWEDRALKGLLRYDVNSCETKVVVGGKSFIVLLNESWNANSFQKHQAKVNRTDCVKFNHAKPDFEDLLFCVADGDKDSPEIVSSATIPLDGMFIVINANPVEYGHIFIVPCNLYQPPNATDKKSLEFVLRFSSEVKNSTFYAFYDRPSSSSHLYFQACYFPNPFPVEFTPIIPFFGEEGGIQIYELADYPTKALVFIGKEHQSLARKVSEICSHLERENTQFSLLVSDFGLKVFLFPQVNIETLPRAETDLRWRSWLGWPGSGTRPSPPCGLGVWGHLVFTDQADLDKATEGEIWKHLAAVSITDSCFEELKLICCNTAAG
ncbi:unnamed protein product [Spirodela intermedia]|uniref:Uncharacterized protein n=1 Tax=Spirodela intermedia TaxID=51605 RepID=A0A7I8JIE3_SPIIN|nr:unnamed protein product [Spirodela intermedia]CAA6669924.1 unnamed protein product [Spirodela intermedia]